MAGGSGPEGIVARAGDGDKGAIDGKLGPDPHGNARTSRGRLLRGNNSAEAVRSRVRRPLRPRPRAAHWRVGQMPQPSLFDDMRETHHRKYNEVLATGKAVVVLAVARTLKQPFRLNDLSVACWQHDPDFFGMKGY